MFGSWRAALAPAVACATIGWLAVLHSVNVANGLNADAVYPLTLASDWRWNGASVSWVIPPAGGLPDVALAWVGLALGREGYANISLCYSVFCVALFLSSWFSLAASGFGRHSAVLASLAAVVLLVLCGAPGDGLTVLYLSPNHHQYTLTASLLTFGLLLSAPRSRTPLALTAVMAVGVFWDPIIIAQAAVPATLFVAARRAAGWHRHALGLGAGVLAGLLLREATELVTPLRHGLQEVRLLQAAESTRALVAALPTTIERASPTRGWVGLAMVLVLTVGMVRGARRSGAASLWSGSQKLVTIVVLATAISTLAPGLFGTWLAPAYYRQQLPVFFLPGLVGLALGAEAILARRRWLALGVAPSVLAWCVTVNREGFDRLFGDDLLLRQHRHLASELRVREVDAVVAEYWDAKPLWLMSRGRLSVCQRGKSGQHFEWIVNTEWCDWLKEGPRRPFAVVTRNAGQKDPFGAPLWTERIGAYSVRLYAGTGKPTD